MRETIGTYIVAREVALAETRAAYETAWQNYQVDSSPLNRLTMDIARRKWTIALVGKEISE